MPKEQTIARKMNLALDASMNQAIDPKLLNDPAFQRVLNDALAIQDRFVAEPIYAKTGKGFLKSAGVDELKATKAAQKNEVTCVDKSPWLDSA
jgi:hypothetical protein